MKKIKTNAMRLLEAQMINYSFHSFGPIGPDQEKSYEEIARSTGQLTEEIYKTILTISGANYYVMVLPGEQVLDFKKAAKILGLKMLELAPLHDLEKITGYVRGGCSPLAMKKQFPTIVDQSALKFSAISVSAGKRGCQIRLAPQDLIKLSNAKVGDICQP